MKIFFATLVGLLLFAEAAFAAPSATLSVTVVPPAVSNCPATPPPQAAAAGYTTLALCIDPASPTYQNISSWVDCNNTQALGFFWYGFGANSPNFSCSHNLSIVTDQTTGKPAIDYHFYANTDSTQCGPNGCYVTNVFRSAPYPPPKSTAGLLGFYPAGAYYETRFRRTPAVTPISGVNFPYTPSFFEWGLDGSLGAGQGPIERDILEARIGVHCANDMVVHDWGAGNHGGGTGALDTCMENTVGQTQNWSGGVTQMHSYGILATNDGAQYDQECGYIDNILVQKIGGLSFGDTNCNSVQNYSPTTSACWQNYQFGYLPAAGNCQMDERYHLSLREQYIFWLGGNVGLNTAYCQSKPACVAAGGYPDSDDLIEYIAVWTCANWQTDNTCSANGITPSAVANVLVAGGNTVTITANSPSTQNIGALTASCISGKTVGACPNTPTYSFSTSPSGTCGAVIQGGSTIAGADNKDFSISGGNLIANAGLAAGGGSGPAGTPVAGTYVVCVEASLAGYTPQVAWFKVSAQ